MSFLRFEGTLFKKGLVAVFKQRPISKKIGFFMFLVQGKNLTPTQVKIKK